MGFSRIIGVCALIPTTMLLAVSFFVLFAIKKTEAQGIKAFGYCVAAFLWISALLVFSAGVYTVSTGRPFKMCPMQQMMQGKRGGMEGCPMMQQMMFGGAKHAGQLQEDSAASTQEAVKN